MKQKGGVAVIEREIGTGEVHEGRGHALVALFAVGIGCVTAWHVAKHFFAGIGEFDGVSGLLFRRVGAAGGREHCAACVPEFGGVAKKTVDGHRISYTQTGRKGSNFRAANLNHIC